jgi:hypothetical protein
MSFKSFHSGELQIGDLIVVGDRYLHLGFYLGTGRNTVQYYTPTQLVWWLDKCSTDPLLRKSYHKPRQVCYIKADPHRVAKFNPDCLVGEELERYNKSLEALKILNIK